MDAYSYISHEVLDRLREEQRRLRDALAELERSAPLVDSLELSARIKALARLYGSHERLVDALIEAVEPDVPHLFGTQD